MKKNEENNSDDLKSKEIMTRRQAMKRIAMGAGLGIAAIVFGAKGADASKNCCIEAYPDYGYGNYYSNYYHNYSYSNYSNTYSDTFYHNYYNYSNYYNSGSYDNTYKDYGYRTNHR